MPWPRSLVVAFVCTLTWVGGDASVVAQVRGVAVQVNEGKPMPTATQLAMVLNPGDFVYDVLGWHKVDKTCDLRTDPARPIKIPARALELYNLVNSAGGKNFVVLGFNNRHCGQPV